MASSQNIRHASHLLHNGGVIAYPTEGVFGLGCLPDDYAAVARVLQIKSRDPSLGLILIVSDAVQLSGWLDQPGPDLAPDGENAVTWIVPATDSVPRWIRGDHTGLAVRLTTHPIARALCDSAKSALVSTSANISGRAPARNSYVLRRQFGALVDYIVPGECGPAAGPSEIRDLRTGKTVRPA